MPKNYSPPHHPVDIVAKKEAELATRRMAEVVKITWDGIGYGSRRGHIRSNSQPFRDEWDIPLDRIPVQTRWELPQINCLPDGGEGCNFLAYTDGSVSGRGAGYGLSLIHI